ncbi:MAG: efflux RND transporter periplasmic adaptor subunit [Candidatus Latescibacterota bacterium]|nr:MAG: efflux RND transporter periplasmic adaptor subunit [Candidatus Latescibacterota bacterium]
MRIGPKLARRVGIAIVIMVAFGLGFLMRGSPGPEPGADQAAGGVAEATLWTCSMHPQIQLPKPGQCPICAMDLIPLEAPDPTDVPRQLVMTEAARRLAEIRTVVVGHHQPETTIRMTGKVEYDETRVVHVTARVPGRLDRLYVDYTGIRVRRGDHMVDLYSPDLLAAQQELLEAQRAVERLAQSDLAVMQQTSRATLDAARDKLRLWGLTDAQIAEIEERGKPTDHVTIYAPIGGIVIEKPVAEGTYVGEGTRIYTIADLERLWVLLDAYESDMSWTRYGQEVLFETEADPGKLFTGVVSFIDPVLHEATRTVKVRVNVDNRDGRLKPGMFVRAQVRAQVDAAGHVVDPRIAGKWICPMHPEVVKNSRGSCSECGMDLVSAESLGYVPEPEEAHDLVVPASAVLITGTRAVVYVEVPETTQPTYEGREILLGPRAGEFYLVRSGLRAGERVVTNGAFKIDSALQIQARPSMMSPKDGGTTPGHGSHGSVPTPSPQEERRGAAPAASSRERQAGPHVFVVSLTALFQRYFEVQEALAADELGRAQAQFARLAHETQLVSHDVLQEPARAEWREFATRIVDASSSGESAANLKTARSAFDDLSKAVIAVEEQFGHAGPATHYRIHCPMAFDNRGADWLQKDDTLRNPYFGKTMLRCGTTEARHPGHDGTATPHGGEQ